MPSTPEVDLAQSVTISPLGIAETGALPAGQAVVFMSRLKIAPGATFSLQRDDPSTTFFVVESGQATVRFDARLSITRRAENVDALSPEEVPASAETLVNQGESFVVPPGISGAMSNEAQEPLVLLVVAMAAEERQPAVVATPESTPS